MAAFLKGFFSYADAFRIIAKYRLWGYLFVPALISVGLGIAVFSTAFLVSDDVAIWLMKWYPLEWGKDALEKVVAFVSGVFVLILGFIIFKNLVLAFSSPFMSALSERVEKYISGKEVNAKFSLSKFTSDLIRGITIALRNVIRELFFTLLLFIIGLFTGLAPVTTVLIFLVQSFYAGFGNIDFTLERHFNVAQSVRFVKRNWMLALGNGTAFMLLLLTGIGFLFALPFGTVGAAVETLKILDQTTPRTDPVEDVLV